MENALAQAPSVVNTTGQHPIVSTDIIEPVEAAVEQGKLCLLLLEFACISLSSHEEEWISYHVVGIQIRNDSFFSY